MSAVSPFREDVELPPAPDVAPSHPAAASIFTEVAEAESWDQPPQETTEWEVEEHEDVAAMPTTPPIPATRLEWPDGSTAERAFMRAVYEQHFRNSVASAKAGKTRPFVWDLPDDQLEAIEERLGARPGKDIQKARPEAARHARLLLAAARTQLAAEGLDGKIRIGIRSAYRPAVHQFRIWESRDDPGKGFRGYYARALRPPVNKRGVAGPPILTAGDYGPASVKAFARYLGRYIAFPGFSNHQNGLALDFGEAGRTLTSFHRGWFFRWLTTNGMENARRFGFAKLESEDWHFNYVGGASAAHEVLETWSSEVASPAVHAGRYEVPRVPLLDAHRGGRSTRPSPKRKDPDLILRWNAMPAVPEEVDVVVHLHGYWYAGLSLVTNVEPVSGLDLEPVDGAAGAGRSRPTLTVLPRGLDTGVKQKVRVKATSGPDAGKWVLVDGPLNVYRFPALVTTDGVEQLVRFSLDRFASQVGGKAPRVGRLILTAHSGGGKPLLEILAHSEHGRFHDPDQVHVFDALYESPGALVDWATRHIRRDRAALAAAGAPRARDYMPARGSALRVFHLTTTPNSVKLLEAIRAELGPEIAPWYRVEPTTFRHMKIPRRYGWEMLADASADVPLAAPKAPPRRRPTRREVDPGEAELDELAAEAWDEDEELEESHEPQTWEAELEDLEDYEDPEDEELDDDELDEEELETFEPTEASEALEGEEPEDEGVQFDVGAGVYRSPSHGEVWSAENEMSFVLPTRVQLERVPLLADHRGDPPDIVLRWNEMQTMPGEIDVVVHLHGSWQAGLKLGHDVLPVSGLDLWPPADERGARRSRPTLGVLPRGHFTDVKQKGGSYYDYTFPALIAKGGLDELLRVSLGRFASYYHAPSTPKVARLILTAHSGGGKALLEILKHHDPDQIHVYDALHGPPGPLVAWAKRHIRKDRAALGSAPGTTVLREYMASRGGALRVFYRDRDPGGARRYSLELARAISPRLTRRLAPWYRVEASKKDDLEIPRRYGWRLLADASADVPDAYVERRARHEAELAEDESDTLSELYAQPAEAPLEPELEGDEEDFDEAVAELEYDFEEDPEHARAAPAPLRPIASSPAAELAAPEVGEELAWEAEETGDEELELGLAEPELVDAETLLEELASTIEAYRSGVRNGGAPAALLETPTAPPATSAPAPVAQGKWVVLVAGFDYERSGVSFEKFAMNRMRLLIRRHAAAERKAKASLKHVIETAPRFVLFDFASGLVRSRVATAPKGDWAWTELARFDPVTAANYSVRASGRRVFDTNPGGRLSVLDVYDHVRQIGRTEPGSLLELSFLAHGWMGGPILVNSDDTRGLGTTDRDPDDKDTRPHKDFVSPTMDATALAEFRAAFDANGFIWVWGCNFTRSPQQVLHRVLSSTKYRRTKLGGIVDADKFTLSFPRADADFFFDDDPTFFPTRGADGKFPLTFERTFAQIKDFFREMQSRTYCQAAAVAAGVPCFGGLLGTYSDYEKGVSLPVMVVPTKVPPYSDNFTRSIRFYTTYLGFTLDPEGRHFGRYDP